ncbi:Crp/Fnr family transcriptional regulator [Maridesulfovibrio salexigens]|uniref:Transcriptional regulator, TrmB n=1 Tax=Maridesulfovibrio salexigens (strain ATCC 14822 / DSM 2638 / NCIMB 8403 / VKM B-1763) TaxID=526222 RepID=C6BRI3_MARSD|nr:Crp/Fnr family transcriptional regulator [Maridesulfovibrio salexigens]ACS79423.1 transcriptional regulator, TrmB [Maridesulfovibrio salexigens DSM 2638]
MSTLKIDEFWRIKGNSDVWNKVIDLGVRQEFKKGEHIILAGETVTELHYLRSGSVRMVRTSLEGNEKVIMHVEHHSLFCEVPFFTEEPITSSFSCHEDAVVYSFPKDTVDNMLAAHPSIAKDIIRTLSMKVSVLSNQLASLGLDTLEKRIVKFILLRYNSTELAENDTISLGSLSMKGVASILGVHRASLYKALKSLEKAGYIRILAENRLQLLNIDALAAIAYH